MLQDINRIHYGYVMSSSLKYESLYITQINLNEINLIINELMRLCNQIPAVLECIHLCPCVECR